MRFPIVILCIALIASFFAGCAQKTNEIPAAPSSEAAIESSSEASSEASVIAAPPSSQAELAPSPNAELRFPGGITVYKIYERAGIYEPYAVSMDKHVVTLLDIVSAVEQQLDVTIPVTSITQQKGMVVVDLAEGFIEGYGKAEIYQILTTLAATLQQNHASFEWIQYQLDGEVGVFGEQWEIPPLKLIEGTPEEFAAIRAQVPYEGLQERLWIEKPPILETDETGLQLTHFLSMLRLFDKDITSPAELDNKHVLETAIYATKYYTTDPNYSENYAPVLKPLEAPASEAVGFFEDWFWLKEHIEESVKLMYGDDFPLRHETVVKYLYHETIGVYTPPHMGGGYNILPVIYHYEDLGDRYRIELAYVIDSMGGYFDPDAELNWEKPIAEAELKQYVETKPKRREVVLKKASGGKLTFESHKYIVN